MGQNVDLIASDGHRLSAYSALPGSAPRGAIVVIQEIFGVTRHIRAVADQYAAAGFNAIAPALFDRVEHGIDVPYTDMAKGFGYMQALKNENVMLDVQAAIDRVAGTGKVGVVGYCWGGYLAYLTAVRHKPDAAVGYYGVGIDKKLDLAKNLSCPLMLHYAELDQYASPEVAAQVRATYKGDPRVTVYEYPQVGHAFARPGGRHFNARASDLADMRTLSFLVETIIGHNKVGIL